MDPIDHFSRLIGQLNQRSENAQASKTEKTARTKQTKQSQETHTRALDPAKDIKEKIAKRLKSMPLAERQTKRAAEIFVESVMLSEFGETLVTNSEFHELVNRVATAIYESPNIAPEFNSLVDALTS
ncbi:MAG: hypothetical protein AAF387_17780 [Pseudomonadota bacterium]